MAGGKMTPRMKMITLMYLVFISMLAMNMSKEVLSAFGQIKEGLTEQNTGMSVKNRQAFSQLQLKANESPSQFGAVLDQAKVVTKASDELFNYLDELKKKLETSFDDPKDYEAMDKSAPLDEIFYEGAPDRKAFLEHMEKYRSTIVGVIGKLYPDISDRVSKDFDVKSKITNREGVSMDYVEYHFSGFPVISSLTKMTNSQSRIRAFENEILSVLLSGQLSQMASFDNYTTLIESPRSSYYEGEVYDGAIVLGRKDASTKPNRVQLKFGNRFLIQGSDYDIQDGRVKLKIKTNSFGDFPLSGSLVFLQDGKEISVPVSSTITIITRPSSAVISAEKMNVVYRGVDNPITISLPGVPSQNLIATAQGLSKSGNEYVMRPGSGRDVKIDVVAIVDGNRISSSKMFRIKDIPRPVGSVSGLYDNVKLPKENLKISTVAAILEDFDFDLKINVNSFKVSVPGQPSVPIQGNRFDDRAKKVIDRAKIGDVIQIFDINASLPGNSSYKLKAIPPVLVTITN